MFDGLNYRRAIKVIDKFVRDISGPRDLVDPNRVFHFYDELAKYLAYFISKGVDGIDYIMMIGSHIVGKIDDNLNNMFLISPLIPLEASYIYLISEDKVISSRLRDILKFSDRGIDILIDNTLRLLRDRGIEDASIFASGVYMAGIDFYFEKDVKHSFDVLRYFTILLTMLGDMVEEAIFSLNIYSFLSILLELYTLNREFSNRLIDVGDKYFRDTYIGRIIKLLDEGVGRDELIPVLGGIVSNMNRKTITREFIAYRWFYDRLRSRDKKLTLLLSRLFSALSKALYSSDTGFIERAERIFGRNGEVKLSLEDEDDIAAAALKLYNLGLYDSFRNLLSFLKRIQDRRGDDAYKYILRVLEFLERS